MLRKLLVTLSLAALSALAGCEAQGSIAAPKIGPPPQATVDLVTVQTNSTNNSIAALLNDVDTSGTGLTITSVTVDQVLPPIGNAPTASTNGNTVTFTPPSNFVGVVTLLYTIADGTGATASSEIVATVLPAGSLPVALPDAATVLQDSAATDIDVLANDVDPAGGGLTLTGVSVTVSLPIATQTVAISGNKVRFTPAAGFAGVVVVTYTVSDVNSNTATGVLSILVSPLDLTVGPVPLPDAAVVAQNSAANDIDVLANDVDLAGGGLTLTGVSATASVPTAVHTVAISGNQVRFTPAAGFAGVVVVTYTATDVNGDSANGVLNIVVAPLALTAGPVAIPDAAVVAQDSGPTDIDVVANDVDPAAGGLTLTAVSVTASLPTATHTLAIAGNKVRFTPAAGFAGSVLVAYTATDVNGTSANGVLGIVVSPTALTVGPVAIPDAAVVAQDSGPTDIDVVANDVDLVGGGLTLTAVSVTTSLPAATHTLAIAGNKVRFTPAAGFAGVVVVSYTVNDANGLLSNGLLAITVSPTPLVLNPVAVPDVGAASSSAGATLFDVLANDVDPAAGGLTLSNVSISTAVPAGAGSVAIVSNEVQYTPTLLYAGAVLIQYTATDVNGHTSVGQLSLTVTP